MASHGWVLASNLLETQLASGAGPVDGHPRLLTSYRAELSGILAILYITYRVSLHFRPIKGRFHLFCDNKGALSKAFHSIKAGVTPYLNMDHDLIELIRYLLDILPITITYEWVKGHYMGRKKELKHYLNYDVDAIAGNYQQR